MKGDSEMAKLLNLLAWRRRRMEHDLDRELRYHIDLVSPS